MQTLFLNNAQFYKLKYSGYIILTLAALLLPSSRPSYAAQPVIDVANLSQNTQTAASTTALSALQAGWYAFETGRWAAELELWREQLTALVAIQSSVTGATRIDAMVRERQIQAQADNLNSNNLIMAQTNVVANNPPPRTANACLRTYFQEIGQIAGGGGPMHQALAQPIAARISLRAASSKDYSGPARTGEEYKETCESWRESSFNCASQTGSTQSAGSRGSARGLVLNGVVGLLIPNREVEDVSKVGANSEEADQNYAIMDSLVKRMAGTIPSPPPKDLIATPAGLNVAREYNEAMAVDAVKAKAIADYVAYYVLPAKDSQFFPITVEACKKAQELGVVLLQDYKCDEYGMSPAMVDKALVGQCMTAATKAQRFEDLYRTAETEQAELICKQMAMLVDQAETMRYQNLVSSLQIPTGFSSISTLSGTQPASLPGESIKSRKQKNYLIEAKSEPRSMQAVASSKSALNPKDLVEHNTGSDGDRDVNRSPQNLVYDTRPAYMQENFILKAVAATLDKSDDN